MWQLWEIEEKLSQEIIFCCFTGYRPLIFVWYLLANSVSVVGTTGRSFTTYCEFLFFYWHWGHHFCTNFGTGFRVQRISFFFKLIQNFTLLLLTEFEKDNSENENEMKDLEKWKENSHDNEKAEEVSGMNWF